LTQLETFPARSCLACCGTCDAWCASRNPWTKKTYAYCPRIGVFLVDNLEATGCASWRLGQHDPFALALYQALTKEGAS